MSTKPAVFSCVFVMLIAFSFPGSFFAQASPKPSLIGNAGIAFASNDGDAMLGAGLHLKLIIPHNAQGDALTVGLDVLLLEYFDEYDVSDGPSRFILGTVGYRKRIGSLYVEPKLGGGYYRGEEYYRFLPDYTPTPCTIIGLESGIDKKRFIYSVDYGLISAGQFMNGSVFHTFLIKVGCRLF